MSQIAGKMLKQLLSPATVPQMEGVMCTTNPRKSQLRATQQSNTPLTDQHTEQPHRNLPHAWFASRCPAASMPGI